MLGYTVPYAIGNILLTAWGPVIVMLPGRHRVGGHPGTLSFRPFRSGGRPAGVK